MDLEETDAELKKEKKRIFLREWTTTQIELSKDEIQQILGICLQKLGVGRSKINSKHKVKDKRQKLISISPTSKDNVYDVTPKNVIGIIELNTQVLIIEPKISVKNILFLLCYSWEPMSWGSTLNLFKEQKERLQSLAQAITSSFIFKVKKSLSKGILQGYCIKEDSLMTIRGRVRWNTQISLHYGQLLPLEVCYDELTEDIEENRLIKAATFTLIKTKNLDPNLRISLRSIETKLDNVSLNSYDPRNLPEIHFTSLNEHYKSAIEIAKFVLRNFTWTLDSFGSFQSPVFLLYMPKIFEDFVVHALREAKAFQSLGLNEKNFPQNLSLKLDINGKINIKPDFSLWRTGKCQLVGDCKYKRLTKKNKSGPDLDLDDDIASNTSDLNQILTYTIATGLSSGILIYAEDKNFSKRNHEPISYPDLPIMNTLTILKRRAINLNVEPSDILQQIEYLAQEMLRTMESQ